MKRLLKTGDVFEIRKGHTVYIALPNHFFYRNEWGVFNKISEDEVTIGKNLNGLDTSIFAGKYEVVHTSFGGGGAGGGGMNGHPDYYPDGHKVKAKMLREKYFSSDEDFFISFYQTGSFTAMVTPDEIEITHLDTPKKGKR